MAISVLICLIIPAALTSYLHTNMCILKESNLLLWIAITLKNLTARHYVNIICHGKSYVIVRLGLYTVHTQLE